MNDDRTFTELAASIEKHLNKARRDLREAERRTCIAAEAGDKTAAAANPHISLALAGVSQAKGHATMAGNMIPDVTVNFGGK